MEQQFSNSFINIKLALLKAQEILRASNIESTIIDSQLLLSHALGCSREDILTNQELIISEDKYELFLEIIHRRKLKEPIAYILGTKEFYSYDFVISHDVLIPRPETELIVDNVIKISKNNPKICPKILDLGTGSGCIIISLLLELPSAIGVAVDISKKALKIASQNVQNHHLAHRIQLIKSEWFKEIPEQKFDFIVSNPPYVAKEDKNMMAAETYLYEPHTALFAANESLSAYKIIASEGKNFLNHDGVIIVEIGYNQLREVSNIFIKEGYLIDEAIQDLEKRDRVIIFRLNA